MDATLKLRSVAEKSVFWLKYEREMHSHARNQLIAVAFPQILSPLKDCIALLRPQRALHCITLHDIAQWIVTN